MIVMKQGDTLPTLEDTLTFSGAPLPLEGCSVRLSLCNEMEREIFRGTAEISDSASGKVRFFWRALQLPSGRYYGRWVVVYPSGDVLSVPNRGTIEILIEPTGTPLAEDA